MLLKEKLSKIRKTGVKVNKLIKELESDIIKQEVRDKVLPLSLNDLDKIHDDLRDYQVMLVLNDNYTNQVELKKIGKIADEVLRLRFSL